MSTIRGQLRTKTWTLGYRPHWTVGSRPSSSTGMAQPFPTGGRRGELRALVEAAERARARPDRRHRHARRQRRRAAGRPADGAGAALLLRQPRLRGLRGEPGGPRARRRPAGDTCGGRGARRGCSGYRRGACAPRCHARRSSRERLNRRKIDLIPEPEWADPPKARIGELLDAVQARLRARGAQGSRRSRRARVRGRARCRAGRSSRDERRQARRDRAHRQGRRRSLGFRGAGTPGDRARPRPDRGRRVRAARRH